LILELSAFHHPGSTCATVARVAPLAENLGLESHFRCLSEVSGSASAHIPGSLGFVLPELLNGMLELRLESEFEPSSTLLGI